MARLAALLALIICFDPCVLLSLGNAMATTEARFLTNTMCPYAQKAWIALECAGIPYRLEEISLYGAGGKPKWFWELNPQGTVPVLVCGCGDMVLPDSDMILDAIERRNIDGAAFSLVEANNNEQVREWRTTINNKLIPAGKQAVLSGSTQTLFGLLRTLDGKVESPFLVGDAVTTADCHAFPFLWRIHQEFGLDNYPSLKQWLDHCGRHPGFRGTIQQSWWWWW